MCFGIVRVSRVCPLPEKQGDTAESRVLPSDPTHVAAPSDAKVEVMQDDTGSFLHIRSSACGSSPSMSARGLEKLAAKHGVARSEEGKETQVSIDCNFGETRRLRAKAAAPSANERNEYLFDVLFPDKHPGAPSPSIPTSTTRVSGWGLVFCSSTIFSENRIPLFGIML